MLLKPLDVDEIACAFLRRDQGLRHEQTASDGEEAARPQTLRHVVLLSLVSSSPEMVSLFRENASPKAPTMMIKYSTPPIRESIRGEV